MISVKGGNGNNNYSDYKIVKDITISELYSDRKYILDEILSISDDEFYKQQILFYYKNLLGNYNYTDNTNNHVDFYIEKLKNKLIEIIKNNDSLYQFDRLCTEFNIKKDLFTALSRLYSKLENNEEFEKTKTDSKLISNEVCIDKKILKNVLKFSKYSKEVLYIYQKFVCGIYVKIKDNKLHIFQPFFNKDYVNNWKNVNFQLFDGTIVNDHFKYYTDKQKFFRKERVIKNMDNWWNNGFIIDNEYYSRFIDGKRVIKYWSNYGFDNMIFILKQVCRNKIVNDCEFIINKRDFPIETNVMPIYSFYSSNLFNNKCIPTNEDIGIIFSETNEELKVRVPWEDKENIALFRGGLNGPGITKETNQRLNLAFLDNSIESLDAKLTTFNMRDRIVLEPKNNDKNKKLYDILKDDKIKKIITTISPQYLKELNVNITKDNYINLEKQSKYKYLIYCEGHSAANRYTALIKSGSIILKVESSCRASEMWYFHLLKPYVHYVPVKADLSDLNDQIEWCKNNDSKCKIISLNNEVFYNTYVTKENVYNYWSSLLNNIENNKCNTFKDSVDIIKEKILLKLNIKTDKLDEFLNKKQLFNKLNLSDIIPNMDINNDDDNNNDLNDKSDVDIIKNLLKKKEIIDNYLLPYIENYEKIMIDSINNIYDIVETL